MPDNMERKVIAPGPNAIEEWAKLVRVSPFVQMNPKVAEDFVFAKMNEEKLDKIDEVIKDLDNGKLGFASVIWKRIKYCHTYKVSAAVCLFLGEYVAGNFGICTMIANYLQYIAHENGIQKITMDSLGFKAFPHGFPDSETWHKLWDAQKVPREFWEQENYSGSDNMLDRAEFMESIRQIGE